MYTILFIYEKLLNCSYEILLVSVCTCMYLKCHYLLSCIFVPNFVIDGAKLLKMLICTVQILYQYMYKKKN